uniref:ELKS/RAB6-interacting/CAST family member 2 n=1 Tax=Poecilia reticulata TaxID=8081 RepID=A0A3P9Q1T2_POERE
MPLNIRAKPSHGKLTAAAAKSGGQNDGSSSHSRFSRSAKQGKGKQAVSSGPGSRSGLEPGSVSGGGPPPAAKLTGAQGSVSKLGSRLKVNTTADKGSARGSATAPGGKTMSMENIQSLSAAYATSGTMYPNERESLEPSGGYPKSTMTLGRSTSRSSYTGRSTAIGSTPNITTSGMHHISDSCGDQTVFSTGTSSLRQKSGRCTQTLDSDDRGENESLRRELDGGRDGKTGYGTNSVNFWSPDVKRDKGSRREEGVRTPALKEQCRVNQEDLQVDALRVRLEEKEQILTKKTKQLQDLSDEKSTLAGEIRDMKDMLDVKERKVNILQKKIENLLEQLKDKDKQLVGLREKVQGLQTDSSNTDTALATLEEALSEKERVIENLRDQKEREDRVRLEEMDQMRRENQELKEKMAALQPSKLIKCLAKYFLQYVSVFLSVYITHPTLTRTRANLKTPKPEETVRICPDIADRLMLLEQEVSRYREESGKSQAEVERLKGALKDAELCNSQDAMRETAERIMELEKALRDTMNTSAHREALWAQEEAARVQAQRQLEELMGALEKTRQELDATKVRLSSTQKCLHDRDGHLNQLRQERRKQLEEILEMKQQALLAAISEKDANIALLELSSSKRKKAQEEVMALKREKDRLMHQLKQQIRISYHTNNKNIGLH